MAEERDTGIIYGFSKLSRADQLAWLKTRVSLSDSTLEVLDNHLHREPALQEVYEDLSENNLSNFYLPLGLSPNFLINGRLWVLPMVTEESSVVAAASAAAKFWAGHGGFHVLVPGDSKVGQVHFTWTGDAEELHRVFEKHRGSLVESVGPLTRRMEKRGGGIRSLDLQPADPVMPGTYVLQVAFGTADAMGANFINTVLEALAAQLPPMMERSGTKGSLEVVMSILSNYTPGSLVQCYVEADISVFEHMDPGLTALQFAQKFKKAVDIAQHDLYRAVTHNKGIFNGMDAVLMATGNDYRAVEACGHAHASGKGSYRSLSSVDLSEDSFRFSLEVPLAVGTVGGATGNHPMAAASLEILGNPSAHELMQIVAAAGLASNFSAIRSLITTGIQQGHMKMHLGNILRQLEASTEESELIRRHFAGRTLSFSEVSAFLESIRTQKPQK